MTFAKIRLALMFSAEHELPIELGSDEVITVLEKLDSLSAETGRAITRAEAAEAELAALREQTRWIPCSERMPEEGQEIYARERGGIITRFKYSNKLRDIFMRHYTHWNWMPLPPPPVTPD